MAIFLGERSEKPKTWNRLHNYLSCSQTATGLCSNAPPDWPKYAINFAAYKKAT
jgi:hypothetical protein